MTTTPSTLQDIRNLVRRITARPSPNQLSNDEIDSQINTYAMYDLPEQIKLETFRTLFKVITQPNQNVYPFPTDYYIQGMPPIFVGGYQVTLSQNRELFYRLNTCLQFIQMDIAIGNGTAGPYACTLQNVPVLPGYNSNLSTTGMDQVNWGVLISGVYTIAGVTKNAILVDDGAGVLRWPSDTLASPSRGTIDYLTGAVSITNFDQVIDNGASITAQYTPYRASRPNSVLFFQDQLIMFPVPDQAYIFTMECFIKPTAMLVAGNSPQIKDIWQLLAYGASDKIFSSNGDMENVAKYRPLLDEQLRLCQRRTIGQYTSDRVATIYTEQNGSVLPFGNSFLGMGP